MVAKDEAREFPSERASVNKSLEANSMEDTTMTRDPEKELDSTKAEPTQVTDTKEVATEELSIKDEKEEKADAAEGTGGEDIVYPSGFKLFATMIALCFAVFLVALDNTIIATAIPRITDQFKVSRTKLIRYARI